MASVPSGWIGALTSSSPAENIHHSPVDTFQATTESVRKKKQQQQQQQPRQLLSCTKCRERKVKCDRTKPCSACCARGQPKDCQFVVAEGGDYEPIQQSYEIRKLRAENLRLKERLRAGRFALSDDEDEPGESDVLAGGRSRHGRASRGSAVRQRAFKSQEPSDSLYFGSPGLASVISDFASLNLRATSLSHTMPRGQDVYFARSSPAYPFATMWPAYPQACIPALLQCLPPQEDLFAYLDEFQRRAQSCSFPHTPEEITKKEVERFLSDAERNAQLYPDMLALLFAALAQGSQNGVFDKSGGKWVEGAMQAEAMKGDVYIAAAMQALRIASFMNRPTLLGIQALIMIGPYLTNSGRFLDAWTLFGATIRLAHSIGLHRNPKYLDPAPPLRECAIRQTLWWWILHMDQQYSMTLGRPLGISGIGDCPPPEPLTTNPTVLRLGSFVNCFTVLARQILSSDKLTSAKIDEFTDRLRALWDTMPEMVRFDETWLDKGKEIPEWPLDAMAAVFYAKIHNYLILLNRQRIDNRTRSRASPPSFNSANPPESHSPLISTTNPQPSTSMPPPPGSPPPLPPSQAQRGNIRGRSLVLTSSLALLHAFLFFYARVPAAMICWTMGQQAFNASMILLLDALETGNQQYLGRVEQAYAVFVEMEKKGVHKLAALAVERISWGMELLRQKEVAQAEVKAQEQARAQATAGSAQAAQQGSAASAQQVGGSASSWQEMAPPPPPQQATVLDTVMGNTGMWLLEDPGLQSFRPSSFTPLAWEMAGRDLGSFPATGADAGAASAQNLNTDSTAGGAMPGTEMQQRQPVQAARGGEGPPPIPEFRAQAYGHQYQQEPLHHPEQRLPPDSGLFYGTPAAVYSAVATQPVFEAQRPVGVDMGGNLGWAARAAPGAGLGWQDWEADPWAERRV